MSVLVTPWLEAWSDPRTRLEVDPSLLRQNVKGGNAPSRNGKVRRADRG